ncbi:hypothetical protein V1517DRAFT_319157 [Lipomyces orientalis]|uniref:Uncharacterized protein n=1 Tax=Lipomyces orientalis TaxID=1233043 RepID=A0ACC3TSN0_9ASCO
MALTGGSYGQVAPPPRLTLTPEERTIYGQLFKSLDSESLGVVTGEVARTLFERSGLSPLVLGRIWQIADDQNNGFLNQTGFAIALRLIGYVQSGQRLAPELASQPGPLPRFEQETPSRVPPLNPAERARFLQLFESTTSDSLLSGDLARDIFVRARLPTETLGQIWNLADIHRRGALDVTEFVIAMHLIQCTLNGSLPALPSSVPQALITAASFGADGGRPSSRTGARASMAPQIPPPQHQHQQPAAPRPRGHQFSVGRQSPAPAAGQVQRQLTGGSVGSHQGFGGFARAGSFPATEDWLITAAQKEHYDSIFASVDREGRGFIGGDIAVPFFMTSKLPDNNLAQIWDLSDIRNTGELSKDEFAVAMYLVQQKLSGNELPQTLPALLVPPSLRSRSPAGAPNPVFLPEPVPASVFDAPSQQFPTQPARPVQPKGESALLDLFDLDDSAFAPPTSVTAPSAPAARAAAPVSQAPAPAKAQSPPPPPPPPQPAASAPSAVPSAPATTFGAVPSPLSPSITGRAPFVPSSAFGQSIQQELTTHSYAPPTPGSTSSRSAPAPASAPPPRAPSSPALSKSSTAASPAVAPQQFSAPPPTSFPRAAPSISASVSSTASPVSVPSTTAGNEDLLLGDDDVKEKIASEKTQFGKLSTEIGSLTAQTQALKDKRAKAEAELAKMLALRQDIEGKLKQLHGVYESEAAKVRAVEQQLATSTNETAKLRQEYAVLESSVHAVQVQYQEVMSNLETDQSENATLKEKIRLVQEQTAQVQEALEKAKRDARQQKGLVAINKKSLVSAESELDAAQKALDESQSQAESAGVVSTAVSSGPEDVARTSDMNPFHRFASPAQSEFNPSDPGTMLPAAAAAAALPASDAPAVPASPPPAVPASIFENMLADFQRSSSQASQPTIASPVVGAPSVEESEASSLPRTGYEDDYDEQIASSPATTTTAATTHLFTNNVASLSGPGGAAALVSGLHAAEVESVSSSVVNNAPESIRDGFSRPESPTLHSHTSSVSAVTASEGGEAPKGADSESLVTPTVLPAVTSEPSAPPAPETTAIDEVATEPAPAESEPLAAEAPTPPAEEGSKEEESDHFALKPKQKHFAGTKEDFDAVFSGLGLLPKKNAIDDTPSETSSGRPFVAEFPPIEHFHIDDESSSDEEPETPGQPMPAYSAPPQEPANTAPSEPVVQAVASAPEAEPALTFPSVPDAAASAPPSDMFASFEDSFATAPFAEAAPSSPPVDSIPATSPFAPSSPVTSFTSKNVQDSFDAVFASFTATAPLPPSEPALPSAPDAHSFEESFPSFPAAFTSSPPQPPPQASTSAPTSQGPPLPPKIPLSGADSLSGLDDFDNAFTGLEDAKAATSANGTASNATDTSFDAAFEDFGKEFGSR